MKRVVIVFIFLAVFGGFALTAFQIVGDVVNGDIANVDDYIDGEVVVENQSERLFCNNLMVPTFPPTGITRNAIAGVSLEDASYRETRKNAYFVYLNGAPKDYMAQLNDAGWKVYGDEGFVPGQFDFTSASTDLIAFKGNEWLTLKFLPSTRKGKEDNTLIMHGKSLVDIDGLTWWLDNYEITGTVIDDSLDDGIFSLGNPDNRNVQKDFVRTCKQYGGKPDYDPNSPESYINPITNMTFLTCLGDGDGLGIFAQRDGTDIKSFHIEFGSSCNISK